jgi:predicted phage baseplate assembly protein
LPESPLTQQPMPPDPEYDADGRLLLGRTDLGTDPTEVAPAVVLLMRFPGGVEELWTPVPDLLNSTPFDQAFATEIDNQGQAILRFGDDEYGRRPTGVTGLRARWRIGDGSAGNLGTGALVHIVTPDPADPLDPANPAAPLVFADVAAVYQPLAARLGTDPQSIEEVRQLAPEAFRAIQFRAVTEQDWRDVAMRNPDVAAAKARFRWTGSWYTVFVAIQPRDAGNLRRLPGGGAVLAPAFAAATEAYLTQFLLAGYELAVQAAIYVPLEIDFTLCVSRGYFGGDVEAAVLRLLSNQDYADGTRGFFHPLNFGFGQSVYLSRLYAALDEVDGLDSATVTVFKRYWEVARDELARGVIAMGEMEIPRLDNDPNLPEDGVLRLTVIGGR